MKEVISNNISNKIFNNAIDIPFILNEGMATPSQYTFKSHKSIAEQTVIPQNKSSYTSELQIEQSLQQYGIAYCKPEQQIGFVGINPSPLFVIPKYKIAIFKEKPSSGITIDADNNWKAVACDITSILSEINVIKAKKLASASNDNQPKTSTFTFVDLYAGIGGFRMPLEKLGGRCLGFSEIDKNAIETYKLNFFGLHDTDEIELGSVTNLEKLPFENIDLIVGGVPCQSWSVAGKMKGFEDPRGQLWNDTIRIVEMNKPKTFIFENVKGLYDPRNKANLDLIVSSFEEIGYTVTYSLLNSYDFGLPQNRERIYIIGIRNDYAKKNKYVFPLPQNKDSYLFDIMDNLKRPTNKNIKEQIEPSILFGNKIPMSRNRFQKLDELNDFFVFCDTRNGHTTIHSWDLISTTEREKQICMVILRNRRKQIYGKDDGNPLSFEVLKSLIPTLLQEELDTLIDKKILRIVAGRGYAFVNSKNSSGINGMYRVYLPTSNIFPTITATGTKDVLALKTVEGKNPEEYKKNFIKEIIETGLFRPLSVREAGKLQGFPNDFAFHRDERIAKKQFGNAVSTNVIYGLGDSLLKLDIFNKQHD